MFLGFFSGFLWIPLPDFCGLISCFLGGVLLVFFVHFHLPRRRIPRENSQVWVSLERFPLQERNSRRANPRFPRIIPREYPAPGTKFQNFPFSGIIPGDHPEAPTFPPFPVTSGPSRISGGSIDPCIDPGSIPGLGSAIPGKNSP